MTAAFRARETKKTYWALVRGVPRKKQDKISTWMVKEITAQGDKMRVCEHGEPDSHHAISYYRVLDTRGRALSWLEMEPYTGRTHQLRVHAAYVDHPIIGDSKYFFLIVIGNYRGNSKPTSPSCTSYSYTSSFRRALGYCRTFTSSYGTKF